ncbi:MAG: hypothetical protein ACAH83_10490 [Alphaproteobacteria bacterium]
MLPILAIPLVPTLLAVFCLSEMKEKTRQHKVSLGIAITAMVLCALLAGASMKDGGILYQIFNTGSFGIMTAACLMVLLPVAALICIFMPSLPGNGRWDRSMRIASFLATGGWCLLAFGATIAIARC